MKPVKKHNPDLEQLNCSCIWCGKNQMGNYYEINGVEINACDDCIKNHCEVCGKYKPSEISFGKCKECTTPDDLNKRINSTLISRAKYKIRLIKSNIENLQNELSETESILKFHKDMVEKFDK